MASRDLTAAFMERRTMAMRRRLPPTGGLDDDPIMITAASGYGVDAGNGQHPRTNTFVDLRGSSDAVYSKLTAGGSSPHDLMLMEEGSAAVGNGIQLTELRNRWNGGSGASGGSSGAGGLLSAPAAPPPAWILEVDAVEQCLLQIQRQMHQLQSMHANRVGSIFGKDLTHQEGRIEALTRQITDAFRTAERCLQKVGLATRQAGGEEAVVGANVQRSLAKRLQELSVTFRQSQRKYLAEVQAQKSGAGLLMPGASGGVSGGAAATALVDSPFGIDMGSGTSSGDDFFTTQQMAVVDDWTSAVQSRDQEIIKIAQSIEELGAIFKELAVLVIDQGTILDRIDYNMEAVVEHTKTGVKQLEKAEKNQKSARPMRCIICLSTTIFVLLLILMIKHRPRHGWF